jgi:hypothetical protein
MGPFSGQRRKKQLALLERMSTALTKMTEDDIE